MSAFHYVNDWSRGGNSKVTPDEFKRAVGLFDVADIFNVFEFIESLGEGKCPHFHDWSWHQAHSDPNDGHEIDQCEWNQLPGYLESQLRMFKYSGRYHWDATHGVSAGFFAEVVARMVTLFFKSHSGSGPYPHGGSPWQPPQPFCARFGNSVKDTGSCLFENAKANGGWRQEFQFIAGPDRLLSKDEWAARVGNTHASMVIFMAMATQEDHHADDPNSIDMQDWIHWMQSTKQAMLPNPRRRRGQKMSRESFGNYAAARVTAELIFEVADGKKNLGGTWTSVFPDLRHELTAMEWMNSFHYVNDWSYGGNAKITSDELKRAVGLSDVNDIFEVFEFFEGLGEGKCPSAHDWHWFQQHTDPNDGHEIDQCEWNQLPNFLESKLRQWQYGSKYHWNAYQGISAGFFSEVVARMVAKFFRDHSKW
ncbi:unnamed protein product [Prorocentrum cordatum]|uniref:Phospholipase B-like n=1 Tax=Prorocentrum cordatum TaxID=2364126 RepID=A0ABN9TA26_9DINO|nr:unnamed protein product [Polarella glacialis]